MIARDALRRRVALLGVRSHVLLGRTGLAALRIS